MSGLNGSWVDGRRGIGGLRLAACRAVTRHYIDTNYIDQRKNIRWRDPRQRRGDAVFPGRDPITVRTWDGQSHERTASALRPGKAKGMKPMRWKGIHAVHRSGTLLGLIRLGGEAKLAKDGGAGR